MYIDVFVAGMGKWYEFKCEEREKIKDIIEQIYFMVINLENIKSSSLEKGSSGLSSIKASDLYLACIDSKEILSKDARLEECMVENGNKLILF